MTISDSIVSSGKIKLLLWLPMRFFVEFKRPGNCVLDFELEGDVETIGSNVKKLKKGDKVIAFISGNDN